MYGEFTYGIVAEVEEAAQRLIPGYVAVTEKTLTALRDVLSKELDDEKWLNSALVTLSWRDEDNGDALVGGATLERAVQPELLDAEPGLMSSYAGHHRLLGSLFVTPEYRGQGHGRKILEAAMNYAGIDSSRYLEGWVSERAESLDFYRAMNATVEGRNSPLPARPCLNIHSVWNPVYGNGAWVWWDLWQLGYVPLCPQCGRVSIYYGAEERLACEQCFPPVPGGGRKR